jgi:simple sugar transport system ATP-binding protein
LTVIENLVLGFENGPFLNLNKAKQKLQQISKTYGLSIDPDRKIQDLSVGGRQRTEILKLLFHESDILILDEPTSMLAPDEINDLFDTLKSFRKAGKSIVLITHHLNEALSISDRITVMLSGKKAAEFSVDELMSMGPEIASNRILEIMFGAAPEPPAVASQSVSADEPLLELKQVAALNNQNVVGLEGVSFRIAKSEILGITSAESEGRRLLAEIIGGQKRTTAGSLFYRGTDITNMSTAERYELGIRYISDDSLNEGCVLDMALSENAVLQSYYRKPFSRFGILNHAEAKSFTADLITRFGIRTTGPDDRINTLSGGNIQKFILARSLSDGPRLIICNNPTHGLDAATVGVIHQLLQNESRRGAAVLLISTDLDELLGCSSRIGVLFEGRISGFMNRSEATAETIGKLMLGISK